MCSANRQVPLDESLASCTFGFHSRPVHGSHQLLRRLWCGAAGRRPRSCTAGSSPPSRGTAWRATRRPPAAPPTAGTPARCRPFRTTKLQVSRSPPGHPHCLCLRAHRKPQGAVAHQTVAAQRQSRCTCWQPLRLARGWQGRAGGLVRMQFAAATPHLARDDIPLIHHPHCSGLRVLAHYHSARRFQNSRAEQFHACSEGRFGTNGSV